MITVSHLTMRLTAGGHVITILDDISLEVPEKQMVAIVGPSGSGKSTLLGLLAGLDKPTAGSIRLDGVEITTMPESQMARYRRQKIGYIFQSFHLIPTLNALENVAVPLELNGDLDAKKRAAGLLAAVGLQDRQSHYPVQLSGGEQQRVAVARAFACHPPILLADEPTGNLDHATATGVIDALIEIVRARGLAALIATHNLELAGRLDRIVALEDGRLKPAG